MKEGNWASWSIQERQQTFLSMAWWRREGHPGQQQPRTGRMLCADGRPLVTEARVRGLLEIGGRIQEESFIVADIEAAAILGAEFLKMN